MMRTAHASLLATLVAAGLIVGGAAIGAEERPDSLGARLDRVEGLASEGRISEARDALVPALRAAPNAERVLHLAARLALADEEPVAALAPLDALARMHPTVARYSYMEGIARLALADLQGAVESLERSLEVEPEVALAWTALGTAQNGLKRYAEAETSLLRALDLSPEHLDTLAALAEAYEGMGALDDAAVTANRVLRSDPGHGRALLILGMVAMKRDRYADARGFLERSLETASTPSKAHYQLSLAYARLGMDEESARQRGLYQEALEREQGRTAELRGEEEP